MYFILSVAFTFFYTIITYQQQDLPGTLQRQGGFIPGIRPGKNTASYLSSVINRITWAGALFLAFVAVMPFLARTVTNVHANPAIESGYANRGGRGAGYHEAAGSSTGHAAL